MQSYNYCHFEAVMSIENDKGLSIDEIDEARKHCQRLTDKAIGQYKTAKEAAANRSMGEMKMRNFEDECNRIMKKEEGERTINEMAMLKQYHDENWREKFQYNYDYDDDDQYNF